MTFKKFIILCIVGLPTFIYYQFVEPFEVDNFFEEVGMSIVISASIVCLMSIYVAFFWSISTAISLTLNEGKNEAFKESNYPEKHFFITLLAFSFLDYILLIWKGRVIIDVIYYF